MPWRKTKDPYAVFVSEFMLQQTTVTTVLPYYDRFLKRFPTLASLAKARLNDVLALWSGLGYYARARNLREAMKTIQRDYNGVIPSSPEELVRLPGVGPYTAGALASFAFNRPAAVLDGNVTRVLMRVLGIEDDPKFKMVQVLLKKVGMELSLMSQRSRAVNLALMDLGATVCVPKNPSCLVCPVSDLCLARQYGKQEDIPLRGDDIDRPRIKRLFAVIKHQGKWLMGQRPKGGLFGGLWEFIGVDAPSGLEPTLYLEEAVLKTTNLKVIVQEALSHFEHHLSHRVLIVRPFLCELKGKQAISLQKGAEVYTSVRWVSPSQLNRYGISSITKRIAAELEP